MKLLKLRPDKILLSGLILAAYPLLGQEADTAEDEVFELSPFEVSVSNDRGYRSTNAISGTSLNTAIRDLPMPLEVINQELIDDLQATDLEEALEYSAGVYTQSFENSSTGANEGRFNDLSPSSTNLNTDFNNTISLRGYVVPNNQRFGFRVGANVPRYNVVLGGSTDSVATERIEVIRGPQALLYGINVLSGVVNIIPKEPLFDKAYQASASVGSYGFRRATVDLTGPLIKNRLAYRLLASYQEDDHWTMFRQTEREDYALQLKWRINPKYDIFLEVKKANFHQQGTGAQYFVDNDSTGTSGYRWENKWNERITFGRDIIDAPLVSDLGYQHENPWVPRSDYEYQDKLYDYGPNFRITGPDTTFDRKELTVTALLRAKFSEHLTGEFGVYHVKQEEDIFSVNIRTFSDSRGPVRPVFGPSEKFGNPPQEKDINTGQHIWFHNPEVNLNGTRTPLDVWNDPDYILNQGLGEAFVFPTYATNPGYPKEVPKEDPQDFSDMKTFNYNRRFARYIWFTDKNDAESTQLRARLAYNFDYDLFGIDANHTFSAGANYIGDIVDFNDASVDANNDNYVYSSNQNSPNNHRQDQDPYYFRDSVLDMTPMRYNGENLAILARPNFSRLAGFQTGAASGKNGSSLARSGKREATLWYRGFYSLYQGKFFEDKLHFIGGIRQDQYQVKETEQLIIIDQDRVSDVWQGSVDPVTPWYIGDGRGEYVSPEGIPDSLDQKVREDYAKLQEQQPKGTTEYNFDDYQKFNTRTFGFSYRIIDPVSIYYLFSEGVFPNTGQRDGAYNPIDAEQTVNNEIGIKFDLMDGKVSGTLSFFKIERENAVFNWRWAPNPQAWHGGINPPNSKTDISGFSPQAATGPGSEYIGGAYLPVTYGVAVEYVEQAFDEMGMADQFPYLPGGFPPGAFEEWAPGSEVEGRGAHGAVPGFGGRTYLYARVGDFDTNPNSAVIKRAFELAQHSNDPYAVPFYMWSSNDVINNNPSNQTGALVTFGEEGTGVDGQLIYSPIPNYQIIFSYSYQKREVTSFHMVDAVDTATGINWGTEYDIWVYLLGEENFSDPTRASTFNGGSVRGMDLSFVPQTSGKIWNMYRFTEGPLDGLGIGGGVQYIGSAPTSVAIGGDQLAENRFPTPDTPERFIFDASIIYRWEWLDMDWWLRLKVNNLLDDRSETVTASYDTILGTVENRRTRIYYNPRTWRLSLTMEF